jgi:hypothetical protein
MTLATRISARLSSTSNTSEASARTERIPGSYRVAGKAVREHLCVIHTLPALVFTRHGRQRLSTSPAIALTLKRCAVSSACVAPLRPPVAVDDGVARMSMTPIHSGSKKLPRRAKRSRAALDEFSQQTVRLACWKPRSTDRATLAKPRGANASGLPIGAAKVARAPRG